MADITESVAIYTPTGRVATQRLHKDLGSGITGPQVVVVNPNGTPIGGSGGPVTVADGADVTQGALADAAVAAGAAGSIAAKLRAISRDLIANIVLAGGENHLGEIGGNSLVLKPALAVSTTPAYSANDVVGGVLTLTGAMRKANGTGVLQDLLVLDSSSTPQKVALEILLYSQNPSHGTYTDNGAFTLDTTDLPFLIRRIPVATTDYVTVGGVALAAASLTNLGRVLQASGAQANLYAIVITSGTPTYSATTALSLSFGLLRD